MSGENWQLFTTIGFFACLLFICGFYCILVTRNLIRTLIGLELLIKAVTLLLIAAGYITNQTALMQSLVVTMIVIEVVVIAIAGGLILRVYKHTETLDTKNLRRLKG